MCGVRFIFLPNGTLRLCTLHYALVPVIIQHGINDCSLTILEGVRAENCNIVKINRLASLPNVKLWKSVEVRDETS